MRDDFTALGDVAPGDEIYFHAPDGTPKHGLVVSLDKSARTLTAITDFSPKKPNEPPRTGTVFSYPHPAPAPAPATEIATEAKTE